MRFALLSTVANVMPERLATFAAAAQAELADVARAWSTVDPSIVPPTVRVVRSVDELTDEDVPILFVAALPPEEVADLAFHYVQADRRGIQRPYALVLADVGMSIVAILLAAFHELAEALVDPLCATYDRGLAREVCDPVQEDFKTRDGEPLSAWVTPKWAGFAYDGPVAVSDAGFDLAPGQRREDGYIMHQDGTQDPPAYHQPATKAWSGSRRSRRQRSALTATLPTGTVRA